jgi:hypothetical protein
MLGCEMTVTQLRIKFIHCFQGMANLQVAKSTLRVWMEPADVLQKSPMIRDDSLVKN